MNLPNPKDSLIILGQNLESQIQDKSRKTESIEPN